VVSRGNQSSFEVYCHQYHPIQLKVSTVQGLNTAQGLELCHTFSVTRRTFLFDLWEISPQSRSGVAIIARDLSRHSSRSQGLKVSTQLKVLTNLTRSEVSYQSDLPSWTITGPPFDCQLGKSDQSPLSRYHKGG